MKIVAIYRLLYGSDFLAESLASIYPHVDRVLCMVTREMFGGRRVVSYFGRDVYLPHDIDGVTDTIRDFQRQHDPDNKVELLDNPFGATLIGQLSSIVNEIAAPRHDPTHVMLVEPDEVWRPDLLARAINAARDPRVDEVMAAPPHLFWRSPRYVTTRTNPYCVLRAVRNGRIPTSGHALAAADQRGVVRTNDPELRVHNFGFAGSARTIFWKHLTSLSFSRDAKLDCPPREEWFEDVWRAWNWQTNRRTDLCPSIGYEHVFPAATRFPERDLPKSIRTRLAERPLLEWLDADGPRNDTSPTQTTEPIAHETVNA